MRRPVAPIAAEVLLLRGHRFRVHLAPPARKPSTRRPCRAAQHPTDAGGLDGDQSGRLRGATTGCLNPATHLRPHPRAGVALTANISLPTLFEQIAAYRRPIARQSSRMVRIMRTCRTLRATAAGQTIVIHISPMPFPRVASQAVAVALSLTASGVQDGENVLLARKGTAVESLVGATLSTPVLTQLQGFGDLAASQIR